MSNNFNLPKKTLTNHRIDFSKISGTLSLPYLVEIQTDSFKWFLSEGIEEVLKDVFPINNYADNLVIEYVGCHFEEPKYDYLECKTRDFTYSAPLKVKLRLRFKETGEIKESDVFMGDFPLMTDSGTFIVNGAERVIVSQLVRSPGAYMSKTMDKSGKWIFEGDLIPTRGTWLEFESDAKDILNVRIDRQRKMFASIFLKALGLTDDEKTLELFDSHPAKKSRKKKADEKGDDELSPLELTLRKDAETRSSNQALFEIFRKLKPGEPRPKKELLILSCRSSSITNAMI